MMKFILSFLIAFLGGSQILEPDVQEINVVMLGDSITSLGKDDCTGEKGWTTYWKEIIRPASCRSYARSGATWSNSPRTKINTKEKVGVITDDNTVYNQVIRLRDAVADGTQPVPDLVMIAAGTNDLWFPKSRPDALATDPEKAWSVPAETVMANGPSHATSISSAMRLVLAELEKICPDATVIVMTPLQFINVSGERFRAGSEIIAGSARLAGAHVIRQDSEAPLDSVAERKKHILTYDGVHPSPEGAKVVGEAIAARTKALLGL